MSDELEHQCPGCGSLNTRNHCTTWAYYCHVCRWGFGLSRPAYEYTRAEITTTRPTE